MIKVIIAGGRNFNNYKLLELKCNKILYELLKNGEEIQIVCGGAEGADTLGEKYAKRCGFIVKRFEADWNQFGKSAGFIRNEEMAKYADCLIAFWNGQSKGTKHIIATAEKLSKKIRIIKYA